MININPFKDIVFHFDIAAKLYEDKESSLAKIDKLILVLEAVNVEIISNGYFYNCSDSPGLCEYDNNSLVYIAPHQISAVRNKEYESLFTIPILEKLRNLAGAMQNIDLYYPLLFKISSNGEIREYQSFKERISKIKLYIKSVNDENKPPHINAIEYLKVMKIVIKENLPQVLDTYHHHVETLRELYPNSK